MSNYRVTILESWMMSFRNVILADIQHSLNGLAPGTILRSHESGLTWKVVSRTIFVQADAQKRFVGEMEAFQHFRFMEPFEEYYEKFKLGVAEKENQGIYQYSIEPIGHKSKPRNGETLGVEYSEGSIG